MENKNTLSYAEISLLLKAVREDVNAHQYPLHETAYNLRAYILQPNNFHATVCRLDLEYITDYYEYGEEYAKEQLEIKNEEATRQIKKWAGEL